MKIEKRWKIRQKKSKRKQIDRKVIDESTNEIEIGVCKCGCNLKFIMLTGFCFEQQRKKKREIFYAKLNFDSLSRTSCMGLSWYRADFVFACAHVPAFARSRARARVDLLWLAVRLFWGRFALWRKVHCRIFPVSLHPFAYSFSFSSKANFPFNINRIASHQ